MGSGDETGLPMTADSSSTTSATTIEIVADGSGEDGVTTAPTSTPESTTSDQSSTSSDETTTTSGSSTSTGCDSADCSECGNEIPEPGEDCDDGNDIDGDGCDTDCSYTDVIVDASFMSTCVLLEGNRVRCWGRNELGQLGYGFTGDLGDELAEVPSLLDDIALPADREVLQLHSGDEHTCALLAGKALGDPSGVVCWGLGTDGRLGYGTDAMWADETVGDDEFPGGLPHVDAGFGDAPIQEVNTGGTHTCVLTASGQIWCWGRGLDGQLGYGDELDVGSALNPVALAEVQVGAAIADLAAGIFQSCAILANDRVRCWGSNAWGQLGYGSTQTVGDDELPSTMAAILFTDENGIAEEPVDIVAGWTFSCALFDSGAVRCWGSNAGGVLGLGFEDPGNPAFGDEPGEDVGSLPPITLLPEGTDQTIVAIAAGDGHACALTDDGELRCWGSGFSGQLGQGTSQDIGDDELPADVPPIDFGGARVIQFDAGGNHTCAVTEQRRLYCFGSNFLGQLGLGHTQSIGDNEPIADDAEVSLF